MSMLDSFFNKGFKAAKCKTLLKLTLPRIRLLRNRRELQLKKMRQEIARLLETGQEATARIRVEHIIREENMMAAQEIIELFCELIAVRLPIIDSQSECPLDLKEAISSVCFAAPRCADLTELLQVQIMFASKYGQEFVSAATELRPDCGVNRQLIELLSVRAPSPEAKLKLLKEIAEEHELDWDPAASETEFSKTHEDLLNGPTLFVSGSKLPLPKGKHSEALNSSTDRADDGQTDSDSAFELDFPEVPKASLQPSANAALAPEIALPATLAINPDADHESSNHSVTTKNLSQEPHLEQGGVIEERPVATRDETPNISVGTKEEKQFLPFISPPSLSSTSFSARQNSSPTSILRTKSEANVDLQDVLAAALAAAESAEHAAAAARSAATLAQVRVNELTKINSDKSPGSENNPFHADTPDQPSNVEKLHFDHQKSFGDPTGVSKSLHTHPFHVDHQVSELPDLSFDKLKVEYDSPRNDHVVNQGSAHQQPQRLPSMDDDNSSPNLFESRSLNLGSSVQPVADNSRHEL